MTPCARCGLTTACQVERSPRCRMLRVAACPRCVAETGGLTRDYQRREHDVRCRRIPRAQDDDGGRARNG